MLELKILERRSSLERALPDNVKVVEIRHGTFNNYFRDILRGTGAVNEFTGEEQTRRYNYQGHNVIVSLSEDSNLYRCRIVGLKTLVFDFRYQ